MNVSAGTIQTRYLLLLFIISCIHSYGQKIQYSRQHILLPYTDATELVPGISGHHHLITYIVNAKPSIHVFDEKLQLVGKKELPFNFQKVLRIRIITFKEYYLLSFTEPGNPLQNIWRINAKGDAVSLTEKFKQLTDTIFKSSTATIQWINQHNQLLITANTYFRPLNKIVATVLKVDENLNILSNRNIVFPFYRNEVLRQVTVSGDDLLILKNSRDSSGFTLQFLKINLDSGNVLINHFNSSADYSFASFKPSIEDSGIIIFAMIKNVVFLTKLDNLLNEKVPVTLLRKQFSNKVSTNYIIFSGEEQQTINMRYGVEKTISRVVDNRSYQQHIAETESEIMRMQRFDQSALEYMAGQQRVTSGSSPGINRYPAGRSSFSEPVQPEIFVRFSVLDKQLKVIGDSVLMNRKNAPDINLRSAANVVLDGKSFVIFNQKFSGKKQGLLAVYKNDQDKITTSDIRVFENYDYSLQQLRPVNNYFILPYRIKREVGLVKVTMNN